MKRKYQFILLSVVITLVVTNIFLFAKTIVIGDAIQKMEIETQQLKIANLDLSKTLYERNSLEALAQDAQGMGFVKVAQPITLKTIATYALAH